MLLLPKQSQEAFTEESTVTVISTQNLAAMMTVASVEYKAPEKQYDSEDDDVIVRSID